MPRRRRVILPGFPHHVTHRGNRRLDIFREDVDYRFYLRKLSEYTRQYAIDLYSYCLMNNHVHLIPVPDSRTALSSCLHDLHGLYADYFNRKYELSGHLWQERFFACVLDNSHLWNAIRYVERNPVRAEIVTRAENYHWSSAQAHCRLREDDLLDEDFPPPGLIPDWSLWLESELSDSELEQIRSATHKGIPYSSKAFAQGLESLLGIRILPRKKGRPIKT
jgi:putative transposase